MPLSDPNGFRRAADATGGASSLEPRSATADLDPLAGETPFPTAMRGIGNIDQPYVGKTQDRETRIVARVEALVEKGCFVLPMMPTTTTALLDLMSKPRTKFDEIARVAQRDPVLASELLLAANSRILNDTPPAETVIQAVLRLGLRNVHAIVLSLSLKTMVSRGSGLAPWAAEVWRQCTSMATLARMMGEVAGLNDEHAFLVGLLHDAGKIPLLDLIHRSIPSRTDLRRTLVTRVFALLHERVGEAMTKTWDLPLELAGVAGCHHDFRANAAYPTEAALASLVHTMDLHLSTGQEQAYRALAEREEFDVLGVPAARRQRILGEAVNVFIAYARGL